MFFRYRREADVLRAELANARGQNSDLNTLILRLQAEWSEREKMLLDRIMALSAPTSFALLNPPPARIPGPRVPQLSRLPGYRPNTEPRKLNGPEV